MLNEITNTDQLLFTRDSDLVFRGSDHKVYDYDGKIVKLSDAQIWHSSDGNYVKPRSYTKECLCTMCIVC
jgi:hypothetical protein